MRDASVVGLSAAALGATGGSVAVTGSRQRRQTVAVFGGGIAGLTAAHELAERGFDVTVYERRAWGGKARSTTVPGTGRGGRQDLPGEHSFRFEFGFYQNIPDTLKRIPFGSNPNGAFDNLVAAPQAVFGRIDKSDLVLPLGELDPRAYTPEQVVDLIVGLMLQMQLPPAAATYFGQRMAVYLSSCDARRQGEWERTSWIDFIGANRFPDDYRKVLGAIPQYTQASKPDTTSTTWVGSALEWVLYGLFGQGTNGPNIRVFDRPTNEAWIDPWLGVLRALGVRLRLGEALVRLKMRRGRIAAALVSGRRGRRVVRADWYVSAMPVEFARRLWNPQMLASAPSLEGMSQLPTGWTNGVQYYLSSRPEIARGIFVCADSPWAASVVPQAQFWKDDFSSTYGDGRAVEKLSAIIADWTKPGVVYGRLPTEMTPAELTHDLWEQMKQHVNDRGRAPKLTDDMLVATDVDPGLVTRRGRLISEDPLVLPTVATAQFRPDISTEIPNLLLCGDYLKSPWEIAIMEAASINGRRVANEILDRTGSREPPAAAIGPYRPPEWEQLKRIDEDRYRRGERNLFDAG